LHNAICGDESGRRVDDSVHQNEPGPASFLIVTKWRAAGPEIFVVITDLPTKRFFANRANQSSVHAADGERRVLKGLGVVFDTDRVHNLVAVKTDARSPDVLVTPRCFWAHSMGP